MSSHFGRLVILPLAVVALAAAAARAQETAGGNEWAHSTELGASIGGATGGGQTGAILGGTAAWQVSRWVAVEGRGGWFDRGTGASGFAADLSALVGFVPKQRVTPYASAGFGLYRASFDSTNGPMSAFYRRRVAAGGAPLGAGATFTDPAFRFGAGVDLIARRNVSFRPEASVMLVRRDGNTETIGTFGLRIAYRFEAHPVTPATDAR